MLTVHSIKQKYYYYSSVLDWSSFSTLPAPSCPPQKEDEEFTSAPLAEGSVCGVVWCGVVCVCVCVCVVGGVRARARTCVCPCSRWPEFDTRGRSGDDETTLPQCASCHLVHPQHNILCGCVSINSALSFLLFLFLCLLIACTSVPDTDSPPVYDYGPLQLHTQGSSKSSRHKQYHYELAYAS